MARELSIVVFGGSGFTGSYVVAELLKSRLDASDGFGRFGIAGRSLSKLRNVCDALDSGDRLAVMPNIDVDDQDSLMLLARSCRLVINAVGPYRLYGEAVVRACVECGTHYLDICGEPDFMERMAHRYNARAVSAGIFVASGAGFDSIPCDVGCILAQRLFKAPAVPSAVTSFFSVKAPLGYSIHYATWQSAVLGFGSVASLRALRKEVKSAAGAVAEVKPPGPRPQQPGGAVYNGHPQVKAWSLPFPGADASVVKRTQAELAAAGEPIVHFGARFTLTSLWTVAITLAVGAVMRLLSGSGWGRALLLRFPGLFSAGAVTRAGPTPVMVDSASCTCTLVATGYSKGPPTNRAAQPDLEAVLRMTLPDPGYKGTALLVVTAAITVLEEQDSLGEPGVRTPGSLLRNTTYAQRLKAAGVRIETLVSPGPPSAASRKSAASRRMVSRQDSQP